VRAIIFRRKGVTGKATILDLLSADRRLQRRRIPNLRVARHSTRTRSGRHRKMPFCHSLYVLTGNLSHTKCVFS